MKSKPKKVTVPESIDGCFEVLKKDSKLVEMYENHKQPKKCKSPLDEIPTGLHFGLGTWIRNNWGLWSKKGSLYTYFKGLGVWHADDMSGIILVSFGRHLRNQSLRVPEQVECYKKFWGDNIPKDAFK